MRRVCISETSFYRIAQKPTRKKPLTRFGCSVRIGAMQTLRIISLTFVLVAFSVPAALADCNAITVAGCGKQEIICVDNSDADIAKKKAAEAFNDKNGCSDAAAKGAAQACASVKCDLRVGA
jgi:sorbitol-specific phosphotransferase system component IIBC